jgi:oxygen-independent coproporphyrinogen-3 oxidase
MIWKGYNPGVISSENSPYSIYIHIPFCQKRCSYCDFNTYSGIESLIPSYMKALRQEIQLVALSVHERLPVHTVFFGGGTPSLLPVDEFENVFSTLHEFYNLVENAEVTIEANPGTLSLTYLQNLRSMGVNRLSLGMQSSQPGELSLLGRQHNFSAVANSVTWARQAGFENLSLDLIFGIPGQTLDHWNETVQKALHLSPEHLSLYALTLEQGTPLESWVSRGIVAAPDDDLAAEMYELAGEVLDKAGYAQYEISNWAKKDREGDLYTCLHNLQYWRFLPYLGFGAGAHGFANQIRTANILDPFRYIEQIQTKGDERLVFPASPAAEEKLAIDRQQAIGEYMMMGLRLVEEGISGRDFQRRFRTSLEDEFGKQITKLREKRLLEYDRDSQVLRLTRGGRLLGNQVFCEFI